jgi:hypothetical protein
MGLVFLLQTQDIVALINKIKNALDCGARRAPKEIMEKRSLGQ